MRIDQDALKKKKSGDKIKLVKCINCGEEVEFDTFGYCDGCYKEVIENVGRES